MNVYVYCCTALCRTAPIDLLISIVGGGGNRQVWMLGSVRSYGL